MFYWLGDSKFLENKEKMFHLMTKTNYYKKAFLFVCTISAILFLNI